MRRRTSASQACGSMPLSFAVTIRVYIAAARSPPRSEPANSHDRRPSAMPRSARSAAVSRGQMQPASRKRAKATQRLRWPAIAFGTPRGVYAVPIARAKERRRRRPRAGERPIITHIDPYRAGDRLAFGQNRDRRVVAVKAFGAEDVSPDQLDDRSEARGAGADPIG